MTIMSHRLSGLGALAVLLVSAGWARAGTVPCAESFEAYANGSAIANQAGWSGEGLVTNEAAAVAAFTTYTNTPGYAAPLPAATHTQVLMIAGPVSNSVSSGTGGVVITDLLLMPAQRDAAPEGSTNAQLACWVTTNDQLVIWHRDVAGGSNTWTTLSGASIKTGAWTRLTVTKAFVSSRYQVAVNGGNTLSDAKGWDAASGGNHPGPWFDMVQTNGCTTRLRTEGDATAYLDDLVFTNRSVSYSATTFVEAPANNGAIATTNTITLYGDTFVNTAYAAGTHFSTSGVPAGLAVALSYLNPTQLRVTLTGNASPHTDAANTAGLGLTLLDGMFTLGAAADVAGRARTDLAVTFSNAPVVNYNPVVFTENEVNDGSIGNTIAVTLAGDTFTNTSPLIANTHYTVSGVPAGLGFKLERGDATHLTASLTNAATAHASVNSTNIVLTLLNTAFDTVAAANITGSSTNLAVNFADTAALSYGTTNFTETAANNGTVNGGTITLAAKTFAGANGTNYVLGGDVTVANLPAGLTLAIVRTNAQEAVLSFGGAATSHESANSISNLMIVFHDSAFSSGNAASVVGYSNGALRVTFANAPVLTCSPTTFTETNKNNGAIGNDVTITLAGESFTNATFAAGTHYTTSGVPAGLTVILTRDNATQVTAHVTGNALAHTNANDTSMTLAFLSAAFQNVAASNITGNTQSLAFDFNDQPSIGYSRQVFTELSGGAINNLTPMIITLSGGDTFTGADGQDFVAAGKIATNNVPAGLTAVIARTSATTLSATLTGAATANANANDVNNLTFVFQDSAITLAAANQVANYSNGTLQVDFSDAVVTVNTVPYRESFEGYADGFELVGTNGWQSGSGSAGAAVTTETAAVTALTNGFTVFPLTTNHTKVLRMTDTLSDEIRSAAGGKLYTDTMLYITAREEPPDGSTNYQFAFYVNTNGQPVVWHRDESVPTNTWLTLTTAPLVTTGAWHRVTLVQDYSTTQAQFYIDGGVALSKPTGGELFTMVGTANNYLSRLRLLGADGSAPSYLDDLVVSPDPPVFLIPVAGTVYRFR